MNFGPGYGGFNGLTHVIGLAFYGIFVLLFIAVALTLAFLLARFLLVGTRAAKIYVEKNGSSVAAPVAPAASTASATVTAPVVSEPTVTKTTSTRATTKPITPVTPAPKPATKPRTPKTPPTP